MGHVAVKHTIHVDASPELVWSIVSDFDSFSDWNPMLIRMKGRAEEGASLAFTARLANGWKAPVWAKVMRVRPAAELRWRAGIAGLFSGEHYVVIERNGSGCVVQHGEDFRGAFVAPFRGLLEGLGGPMYARMNEALKLRAEAKTSNL